MVLSPGSAALRRCLLLGSLLLPAAAQAALIGLEPLDPVGSPTQVTLDPGETARLAVLVDQIPAGGLAAYQFSIIFDPPVIAVSDPNAGSPFDNFVPLGGDSFCAIVRGTPSCEDPDWFLTSTGRTPVRAEELIDNAAGIVTMAYGTQPGPAPPAGGGTIALIDITAGPPSTTTTLEFRDVILADDGEPPTSYTLTATSMQVIVTPEPAALGLQATGLGLLAWGARSRRARRARPPTDG